MLNYRCSLIKFVLMNFNIYFRRTKVDLGQNRWNLSDSTLVQPGGWMRFAIPSTNVIPPKFQPAINKKKNTVGSIFIECAQLTDHMQQLHISTRRLVSRLHPTTPLLHKPTMHTTKWLIYVKYPSRKIIIEYTNKQAGIHITSGRVWPHASHIFNILVRWSSTCSTRFHRSVMTYWFPMWSMVMAVLAMLLLPLPAVVSLAAFKPWSRSNASTNCAHVVSLVMPEIQRCSPCTQIGISSMWHPIAVTLPLSMSPSSSSSSSQDEAGDWDEFNECLPTPLRVSLPLFMTYEDESLCRPTWWLPLACNLQ